MLGLLLLAGLAAPASALLERNTTLRDNSAMLIYSDPSNTTTDLGWNETYSDVGWDLYNPKAMPEGDSAHTSAKVGASVSISWVGTGVFFHGEGDVDIEVDGESRYRGALDGGGVGVGGLEYTAHTAKLEVQGVVKITNVTLTTVIGGDGAVDVDAEVNSLDKNTNTNTDIKVTGRWGESTSFCGSMENATWSSSNCFRFDSIGTEQKDAMLVINVPANASIARMTGAVGSAHGTYDVILQPPPPHASAKMSLSAKRAWMGFGNLFFASLDPTVRYTMRVRFTGGPGQVFEWGNARFIVTQGGETWSPGASGVVSGSSGSAADGSRKPESPAEEQNRSSTPLGAIIGAVVGGIAVLGLLGGIIWRRCRRRRTGEKMVMAGGAGKGRWRRRSALSTFEVDVVDQTNQTGALGTYHPMVDPVRAGHEMTPDSAENRITPLPTPWPGDMVGHSSGSSKGGSGKGGSGYYSQPSAPSQSSYSQGQHSFSAPQSTYSQHSHSQHSQHSYPPAKSPFADPMGMPMSPATSTAPSHSSFTKGAPPLPPRPTVVTEAEDAGRVVEEQVPPRYNPAWADDGSRR